MKIKKNNMNVPYVWPVTHAMKNLRSILYLFMRVRSHSNAIVARKALFPDTTLHNTKVLFMILKNLSNVSH